jgi:hypothetical protein
MKNILSELKSNSSESENSAPLHLASLYYLDKELTKEKTLHNYSSSPDAENEYQEMIEKKNQKTLVDINSEPLKIEYSKKLNYLNNGLNSVLTLSVLFLLDSCLNLKYLGPSELTISVLVLASLSIAMIILIIMNIKFKILMDPIGYVLFYLFSMILSLLLSGLYMMKIINFIIIFRRLNGHKVCRNKYKCPGYFAYLLLLMFSLVLFIGILICIKFTFLLFFDGFNVLAMKKKTIIQRQIELNESKEKSGAIEFVEEDSINNSTYKLDGDDNLKTE